MFRLIRNFTNWFKPPEIEKPDCVLKLLERIYPTIDWSKVKFHNGLPWFVSTFSPATEAITIPGTYSFNNIHIYFKNFDPCSCKGLATIIHEGFHVLQYNDIGTGGIGWIRLFMIEYFACCIKLGRNCYDEHPMEIAAYKFEEEFRKCCNTLTKPICDCSTNPPTFNQSALDQLFLNCPDLVRMSSGFKYNCGFFFAVLGTILSIIIATLLPVIDLIFLVVDLILLIVALILCALEWLWNLLLQILQAICNWTIVWEKQCKQWAQQTIQQCLQYQDQGYQACAQYQDQGYQACAQYQDQGYQACANWAKNCCTWWPCSWGCKLFSWICVAWYWVTNLVCVAWYWVTNLVCVAWYWVSSWVCIAWATIVRWICVAFAWVIKTITCW